MKHKSLLFSSALILAMIGCSSLQTGGSQDTSQKVIAKAENVIGPAAVQFLAAEATHALAGGLTGKQALQDAATALWTNINNVNSPTDAKSLVVQAGVRALGGVVQSVFSKAANGSPVAVTNAIAAVLSTVGGAPPPPATVK